MTPFRISVCGLFEVQDFEADSVTHIISIDNPGPPTGTPEWFRGTHWHVVFQDVETPIEAREYNAVAPSIQEVERIIDFGGTCQEAGRTQDVHLLIHCMAGTSRSPAAAFAILCMINGEGTESACIEELLAIRPRAFPNRLVVKYADDLLKRDGKMLKALRLLYERRN